MDTRQVDVAIIGAGTAGLAAFRAARKAGADAVLIEGGAYGTTCARVGCMPSKLLIAAADAAHAIGRAPGFGVHTDGALRIDGHEVMGRVRRERDRFIDFVLRDIEEIGESHRLYGPARFAGDHELVIGERTALTAKSIVVATGAVATRPEAFRTLGDRLITSDDVFDWHHLPAAVAVVGPGIVGLELGQALHRLGVRVVVYGHGGRVGPIGDPQVAAYALATFREEFPLEPDANLGPMERHGERVAIRRAGRPGPGDAEYFDYVLAATGRVPNLERLDLAKTTLSLDAKGVPAYDPATTRAINLRGDSAIFLAGDADNHIPLLHEALDEGRIAGTNAARLARGDAIEAGHRRAPMAVVFTDPQIAIVGGGFRRLKAGTFVTGRASFEDQGRARILLRNSGLLHVYADLDSGRFLGAEMLAPDAEHLAHLLAWALQNQMTIAQMLAMPFYHPVIEEGVRTALHDAKAKLRAAHAPLGKAA